MIACPEQAYQKMRSQTEQTQLLDSEAESHPSRGLLLRTLKSVAVGIIVAVTILCLVVGAYEMAYSLGLAPNAKEVQGWLHEKVGGRPATLPPKNPGSWPFEPLSWEQARARAKDLAARLSLREKASLLTGRWSLAFVGLTDGLPSYGVPALKMQDASSGFRTTLPWEAGTTTQFPSMLCLASSWDEELVGRVAAAIAREFRGKGANVLLGPGLNVNRIARGGRNFEYISGEDPHLGARLAASYVKAVQTEGVMAVAKHFAFNEQETGRMQESSDVDARTAWETYYPPFQAAVDAGVAAIMCAYNQVNGTYACENAALLLRDLKGEMGFQGFVMTDWGAVSGTKAMAHGTDMEMPVAQYFPPWALTQEVSEAAITESAVRVLSAMYRLRIDEQPGCQSPCEDERRSNQRTEEHLKLAEEAAAASVILLKNGKGTEPILPISSGVKSIVVLGSAANAIDTENEWRGSSYAGGGSGHVLAPDVVTPLEGIKSRAAKDKIQVTSYAGSSVAEALLASQAPDMAIIVVSTTTEEGQDRPNLDLPDAEIIRAVSKVKPTIVLVQAPGAVLMPWKEAVDAIAILFLAGEQTGFAWASLLFGDISPRGKLPIALPRARRDTLDPGLGPALKYSEGSFFSYRSESSFSFPFGHGLSYSSFKYASPKRVACRSSAVVCIMVTVINSGMRAASETVQVYVSFPRHVSSPSMLLRGFQSTKLLHPSEHELLQLAFSRRDMSIYAVGKGWEVEPEVVLHLGSSSADIKHSLTIFPENVTS